MIESFTQGYLDSLCGIYSIINADRVVNNSSFMESQTLFNNIIEYLSEKKILKDIVIIGSDHKVMKDLIKGVAGERFPLHITNKRGIIKVNDWWNYSRNFLEEKPNRAIIISLGGREYHLTVTNRISDRLIYLKDSSNVRAILRKSSCSLAGYTENDKYIIYPSQCWYLGKE